MSDFPKETGSAFTGGFIGGIAICGILFFGDIFDFASQYLIKLLLTGVGGIIGGFGTSWGKHLFDKFKNKKKVKHEKEVERDDKERVA